MSAICEIERMQFKIATSSDAMLLGSAPVILRNC
jgi:hypothetical protein